MGSLESSADTIVRYCSKREFTDADNPKQKDVIERAIVNILTRDSARVSKIVSFSLTFNYSAVDRVSLDRL